MVFTLPATAIQRHQIENFATNQIENVIKGIVGEGRVTVALSITLRAKPQASSVQTYLPDLNKEQKTDTIKSLTPFVPLIETVQGVIALDEGVDEQTIGIIKEVIKLRLGVSDDIISALQFIKIPKKQSEESPLSKELDTIREQLKLLESENDELQGQINREKREKAAANRTLTQTKAQLEDARQEILETIARAKKEQPRPFFDRNESHFLWIISAFLIGVISIILLMIPSKLFLKGLTNVSDAVKDMGRSLAEAAKSETPNNTVSGQPKDESAQAPAKFADLPALPPDVLEKRLDQFSSELSEYLRHNDHSGIVSYMSEQIREKNQATKVVLLFEQLGEEFSEALFDQLSSSDQNQFSAYLRKYKPPRAKSQMTLDTFEEIKTRLENRKFRNILAELNDTISLKLGSLKTEEILSFIEQSSKSWWPRILLHLQPNIVAEIIAKGASREAIGEDIITASVTISDHRSSTQFDSDIVKELQKQEDEVSDSNSLPVRSFLLEVVDSLPQETAKQLVQHAEANNENLGRIIGQHLITLEDFWHMESKTLASVIAKLSTSDIAILMKIDPERGDQVLWDNIPKRRQELIRDEMDMFESELNPEDSSKIETKIIALLKDMREAGTWSKDNSETSSSLPAAS